MGLQRDGLVDEEFRFGVCCGLTGAGQSSGGASEEPCAGLHRPWGRFGLAEQALEVRVDDLAMCRFVWTRATELEERDEEVSDGFEAAQGKRP